MHLYVPRKIHCVSMQIPISVVHHRVVRQHRVVRKYLPVWGEKETKKKKKERKQSQTKPNKQTLYTHNQTITAIIHSHPASCCELMKELFISVYFIAIARESSYT